MLCKTYRNDPKFSTDMPGQTVQTQIRLLEEQSDQGLHCAIPSALFGLITPW